MVVYVKPSSSCRTALILGMGKMFSHHPFVEFPKIADSPHGVVSFGIINVGEAHS